MIDRKKFYERIRGSVFRNRLSQSQVDGLENLLNVWDAFYSSLPKEYLAYCLATAYHETAQTMQPIREYGRGRGRKYGKVDRETGHAYYGRGYVQLTWRYNYEKAGKKLERDFVNNPDLVMNPRDAADILFTGSIEGWFTGKKLSQYVTPNRKDYRGARRIINGMDRASLIAGYAKEFNEALVTVLEQEPVAAITTGKPIYKSTTALSAVATTATSTIAAVEGLADKSIWLAGAVIVAAICFGAFIIYERYRKSRDHGI